VRGFTTTKWCFESQQARVHHPRRPLTCRCVGMSKHPHRCRPPQNFSSAPREAAGVDWRRVLSGGARYAGTALPLNSEFHMGGVEVTHVNAMGHPRADAEPLRLLSEFIAVPLRVRNQSREWSSSTAQPPFASRPRGWTSRAGLAPLSPRRWRPRGFSTVPISTVRSSRGKCR
jgi:hypothetical protein